MGLTEDFAELFAGRTDAYGTEQGGSQRYLDNPSMDGLRGWRPLWAGHLEGVKPIGVYPMVYGGTPLVQPPQWHVKWGCVDFDIAGPTHTKVDYETEAEAHDAARTLVSVLKHFGITGWIERTRSGGRHVWVFLRAWVDAPTVRRALLAACEIAEVATREVNPKQEALPEGALGNYVRLPYPGGKADGALVRCVYATPSDSVYTYAAEFVSHALESRVGAAEMHALAKLWIPPAPPKVQFTPEDVADSTDRDLEELRPRMSGITYVTWQKGPPLGGDRSDTLFRLALRAFDDGFSAPEVLRVVADADKRWGKYHARGDADVQLPRLVERASR